MRRFALVVIGMALIFGLWGCATVEVAQPPPPAPRQKLPTYYYVGAIELQLKEAPDNSAKDKVLVRLNEKVEKVEGSGGWFQVSTADGRSGWASSKYFELKPVTNLYVSNKGIYLRAAPDEKSKEVCKLQVNDLIKIMDPRPQNWVEVSVERTKSKGWLEVKNLSKDPMAVSKRTLKRKEPAKSNKGEAEASKDEAAPAAGSPVPSAPEAL
jgi:SH3-like domain-containing protein